ncbi:MAG TPA: site-specific tyrosine recombinase XerD [Spirochaetia bacterium]|nr:MAG: hypothetical protein A2Y41_00855 [Spirochaetes bacterium GWB1_36_13]HCL55438.1 site-specific tyrosine recombinase XerD [Spirochaetia bacterium]
MTDKFFDQFAYYLRFHGKYSENTVLSYLSDLGEFKKYLDEKKLTLESVAHPDILLFLSGISANNRTKARYLSSLKSFFQFLADFEKLSSKIDFQGIASPKIGKHLPEYLDLEEIKVFFSCFQGADRETLRDKAMAEALYSCGLRISEMISLELQNLNLEEHFMIVSGKGSKERFVPFGSIFQESVLEYLLKSRGDFLGKKNSSFLFLTRLGRPFTRVGAWKIIKKHAFLSGLPKNIKPHMFRHSFATHLLSNGADLRIIQELLGHSDIATTQIYTHVANEELKKMIDLYHPLSR